MTVDAGQGTKDRGTENSSEERNLGWVLGAVWLVFLIYPINALVEADRSTPAKIVGALLIALFAAVYLLVQLTLSYDPEDRPASRSYCLLLTLTAIALCLLPIIGQAILGFGPYLVAIAMLMLPLPTASAIAAVILASTVIWPALTGRIANWWFISVVVVVTAIATGVVPIMQRRDAEDAMLRHQLSIVGERERVARDVHDVLGHSLTIVAMKAELAERLLPTDPERAAAELRDLQSLTREALAEVRATVGGLRVARLADELAQARSALETASIAAQLPDNAEVVDPRFRILFAWVLREAVTNVVRHSGASRCIVQVTEREISIEDDGRGLATARGDGNGLRGIRERVEDAGGRMEITSDPDNGGTTVRAVI